jgi:hypothetical protein
MTKLPPQQVGQRDHCENCGNAVPDGQAWLADSDAAHGGFTVCEECHREEQEAIRSQEADEQELGLDSTQEESLREIWADIGRQELKP